VTPFISQIALAASMLTMSDLCRSRPSRKSYICLCTLIGKRGISLSESPERSRTQDNPLRIVLHDLAGVSYKHTDSHRVPQHAAGSSFTTAAELLDHLGDCHSVLLPDQIEQTEGVILHDVAGALDLTRGRSIAVPVTSSEVAGGHSEHTSGRYCFSVNRLLGFVSPPFDGISSDRMKMVGGDESGRGDRRVAVHDG